MMHIICLICHLMHNSYGPSESLAHIMSWSYLSGIDSSVLLSRHGERPDSLSRNVIPDHAFRPVQVATKYGEHHHQLLMFAHVDQPLGGAMLRNAPQTHVLCSCSWGEEIIDVRASAPEQHVPPKSSTSIQDDEDCHRCPLGLKHVACLKAPLIVR